MGYRRTWFKWWDHEKGFGHHVILQDMNFSFSVGKIVGLVAPNGAGKTTIMKILLGFRPRTRGTFGFRVKPFRPKRIQS
ncbi:ATP-binding cassette domain-containing protein [Levilactobacillus yiduensis]|uniref:ATP-binding cassette domain-containing protein n=1 Tax=Levilactobacillus yiduensis TaxID=2953880 RepID=UPI00358E5EF4